MIHENNREELQKFICGIINRRNAKSLAIYCMPDHVHILIWMTPTVLLSDLVRDVKAGSSQFINDKGWVKDIFRWQEGFGAFSYSSSSVKNVVNYILNQAVHHQKKKFKDGYINILQEYEIAYDEKYLFEWL